MVGFSQLIIQGDGPIESIQRRGIILAEGIKESPYCSKALASLGIEELVCVIVTGLPDQYFSRAKYALPKT